MTTLQKLSDTYGCIDCRDLGSRQLETLRDGLKQVSANEIKSASDGRVFIELLRRGYQVYIGKIKEYEIDFIAEKNGEKEYFQVCYLLTNQDVVEREYRPLQQINDNFPKTILSMDELPASNTDGILRLNLRQWLLKT